MSNQSARAMKIKYESKIILDFSDTKSSKHFIEQSIRNADFTCMIRDANIVTHVDHVVKVGIYNICIAIAPQRRKINSAKLRDYGKFYIHIVDGSKYDQSETYNYCEIILTTDPLFMGQYWVYKNFTEWLRIKDLINVIQYLVKLNKIKAFL